MSQIALVVITDGRGDYLKQTLASAGQNLRADWRARILVDDSGDPAYAAELAATYPDWHGISHVERQGFAAAVRTAWSAALTPAVEYVFHLEEDFTFNQPVDVQAMADLLDTNPELAQIALKRQPVNPAEEAAGGFMQTRPRDTWQWRDGWTQHTLNFTTNPSLIPRRAIEDVLRDHKPLTEPTVTDCLLEYGYRFAYLGAVDDPPLVTHIGDVRSPGWLQ